MLSSSPGPDWPAFFRVHLLGWGLALGAAGVVLFFAANWKALSFAAREGLLLGGLVVSQLVAAQLGTDTRGGRGAVLVGGLLIGPALAVYGQHYQTGADSWLLFAGWAGLLLPFTVVARSPGMWLFQLCLTQLTVFLYTDQTRTHAEPWWLGSGAAWAACLVVFERLRRSDPDTEGAWLGPVLAAAAGLFLAAPFAAELEARSLAGFDGVAWVSGAVTAGYAAALIALYRRRGRLLPQALGGALLILVVTGLVVLGLALDTEARLGIGGLVVLGLVAWLASWLNGQLGGRRPSWGADALLGAGVWLGASAFTAGTLLVVAGFLRDVPLESAGGIGLVLLVAACLLSRRRPASFVAGQLVLVLSFIGHVFWLGGLSAAGDDGAILAGLILTQLVVVVAIDSRLHRFLSTVAAALLLVIAVRHEGWPALFQETAALGAAGLGAAVFGLGLGREPGGLRGWAGWRPVGAACVVVLLLHAMSFDLHPYGRDPWFAAPWLVVAGLITVAGALIVKASASASPERRRAARAGGLVALVAVAALSQGSSAVLAGLLVLLLAEVADERWLRALAVVGLLGALVSFTYSLEVPLLDKAGIVGGTGLLLLVLRLLSLRFFEADRPEGRPAWLRARLSREHALLAAACAGVLTVVVGLAAERELARRDAEVVFLRLGPADPRSLIQGDYMTLRYRERAWHRAERTADGERVLLWRDGDGVLTVRRPDDEEAERRAVRPFGRRGQLAPRTFLFEEGQGERYQRARFAKLLLDDEGRLHLVDLVQAPAR